MKCSEGDHAKICSHVTVHLGDLWFPLQVNRACDRLQSSKQHRHRHHRRIKMSGTNSTNMQTDETCPLETFIRKAERVLFDQRCPRRGIFETVTNGDTPRVRKGPGKDNQIIIYHGCFNPPHEGHRELLCRAYLGTDQRVIAAMILPADIPELAEKEYTEEGDRTFLLSGRQRAHLWRDEFVSRWSWVFPGPPHLLSAFLRIMHYIAFDEGYELSFPSLAGAEHVSIERGLEKREYGSGSIISSDINRSAEFVKMNSTGQRMCHRLPACGPWKHIEHSHIEGHDKVECWGGLEFCSACWKLYHMSPHLRDAKTLDGMKEPPPL